MRTFLKTSPKRQRGSPAKSSLALRASVSFLLLLAGFQAQAAEPPASLAVPRDGESYPAVLLRIEADGQIMLAVDGQPRTVPAEKLIRWGAPAVPAVGSPIVLAADGSVVPLDVTLESPTLKNDKLACDTRRLGRLQLSLSSVRGLVMRPPSQTLDADLLARQIIDAEGNSDQLILDNGDHLSGTIGELGAEKLKLDVEGRPLEVAVNNIVAIIFNPALTRAPNQGAPPIWVGLSDGTRLNCSRAASEGTTLRLTTLGGLELKTPLANVVWLQPLSSKVTYLSDLQAAGFKHTPYLSLTWPYYRDRNVLGGQLRSGGRAYLKGLGLHSTSLVSYALPKPFRRLDAELGIDDVSAGAASRGSVIFRVYVDTGDGQWKRRYESPVIRGGQQPTPISVDVAGAKRIGLLVDVADRGDELDHADWLDVRLVP